VLSTQLPTAKVLALLLSALSVRATMEYRFLDAGHTAARDETTLDVGGALPSWLVELAIEKVPVSRMNEVGFS
jgi:hypothetical protein